MLNRVVLVGRLTRKPELRFTPNSGLAVATFTLAVQRNYPNQAGEYEADFVPIVVWRKKAEACAEHLDKGGMVAVDGKLQIRSYDQDGQKRYITEVVAEDVRFLEKRSSGGSQQSLADDLGREVDDQDIPF